MLLPVLAITTAPVILAQRAASASDLVRYYLHRTYSWQRTALLGLDTGFDHLITGVPEGSGGMDRFGSRYGDAFARRASRNSMELGLGILLGEDPRYHPSGQRGLGRRLRHAAIYTIFCARPDGGRHVSVSRLAPAVGTDLLASTWERRPFTAGNVMANIGWTLAGDLQTRCLDEFGPDLKRLGQHIGRMLLRSRTISTLSAPLPMLRQNPRSTVLR